MTIGIQLPQLKLPESTDYAETISDNRELGGRSKSGHTECSDYGELQPGKHLMGKVVGHTALANGECVYTSPILRVDVNKGQVETRNTVYQLGKPTDGYRSWEQEHKVGAAA